MFIYQKDIRGRRLYIATQGKLYTNVLLSICPNVYDIVVVFCFYFTLFYHLRPKAKNNCRFLDYDLARRSMQHRMSNESHGRNKGWSAFKGYKHFNNALFRNEKYHENKINLFAILTSKEIWCFFITITIFYFLSHYKYDFFL